MPGVLVNVAAVLAGSLLGLLLRRGISPRVSGAVMQALGLCILYLGISGALKGQSPLVAIVAMVLGTALGTALNIEGAINRLGQGGRALCDP